MPKRYLRNEKGFTMIEMMVVLVIIAVLIGGGIKFYLGYIENAKVTKAKAQISTMQAVLDACYAENGSYPGAVAELVNTGIKTKGEDSTTILEAIDPWGKNYLYDVDTSKKMYVIHTGHNTVQDQVDTYVAGEGKDGNVISLEITKDISPDGN